MHNVVSAERAISTTCYKLTGAQQAQALQSAVTHSEEYCQENYTVSKIVNENTAVHVSLVSVETARIAE